MKKRLFLFIILSTLLFLSGCINNDATKVENKEEDVVVKGELLSSYPEDILPLYKAVSIEDVSFTYRDDPNYVIGKDYNYVYYISSGDIDEISDYYISLMTFIEGKDESWFDKYYPTGEINGQHVNIGINDLDDENGYISVSVSIGVKEEDYVDKNPYFINYPDVLDDLYRKTKLQDITYKISYIYSKETYLVIFQTDMDENEFLEYYKNKYENKTGFSIKDTDLGKYLMWNENNFDVSIRYNVSANYKFISISAEKSM